MAAGATPVDRARRCSGDVTKLVWLDCDLLFEDEAWAEKTSDLLDKVPFAQPFGSVRDLGPGDTGAKKPGSSRFEPSTCFAHKVGSARRVDDVFERMASGPEQRTRFGTGLGWAFRRELYVEHDFYASGIVGGNDVAMACAAFGRFDVVERNWHMNADQLAHYRAWAEPYSRTVCGEVAGIDGQVLHLWHGQIANRRYRQRFSDLAPYAFDPFTDIALDEGGAWRWNSDKPDLHRYVQGWFVGRDEDAA